MRRGNRAFFRSPIGDLTAARADSQISRVKAAIVDSIRAESERRGLSAAQLCDILDLYHPQVENLLAGNTSKASIEKLLGYANRLNLQSDITLSARFGAAPLVVADGCLKHRSSR